ncbi:MAG: FecR domain-containing protein [Verrucomicrobia bacterium]|nr:FecR domain-containing protein [Verrucomicrobiota bacterium]
MKKALSAGLGFFGMVFMAGLVAVTNVNAGPSAARITIKATSGEVSCSNDFSIYPIQAGDSIAAGTVIMTGTNSTADLILPDSGTVLRVLPESSMSFSRLNKEPAGEQIVTETSLKVLKGSVIGSQRKLAVPSRFYIATEKSVATIVGTEYVVSASGAVTVLDGQVSINYNLPGNKGSVKVSIPQGYSFDPATGTVVPTSPQYLQNIIADVNTVQQNAQTFKAGGATIVVKPETFVTPTKPGKGNNGVGNGVDPQPPGNPPVNDGPGTSPGNPGNKGGANK